MEGALMEMVCKICVGVAVACAEDGALTIVYMLCCTQLSRVILQMLLPYGLLKVRSFARWLPCSSFLEATGL